MEIREAMKKWGWIVIASSIGFGAGVLTYFFYINEKSTDVIDLSVIKTLIENSGVEIPEERNACGHQGSPTVGDFLAGAVYGNAGKAINSMSSGCMDGVCYLSVDYCRPWQDSECNQTFLNYQTSVDTENLFEETISCFDIP